MAVAADEIYRRLRDWPRGFAVDQRTLVQKALEGCCTIFEAPEAVMIWEDREEPWLIVAAASASRFTWTEEDPDRYSPPVDALLDDQTFYVTGTEVRTATDEVVSVVAPIHDGLQQAFSMNVVISTPLRGEAIQGRIFIIRPSETSHRSLLLAEVVGLLIERDMDYATSVRSASRNAVHEERIRVARDLHDGLLQSFTGIVLQLETIHSMIETAPQEARRMITDVEGVIMTDQRELRSYVEQLRPRRRIDVPFDFFSRMDELRERFEKQWGLSVAFDIESVDPLVARSLGPETFRIIQESVTNSAKHGSATHVRVRLATGESHIRIEVIDDGSGFPFHGRRTLAEIRESGVGPTMLAERVAALNGDLAVESSVSGAKVEISVPLGFSGA